VLQGLPGLASLSLVEAGISEDSLAHVGRCTKLTRLELQVRVGARVQVWVALCGMQLRARATCPLS
jgi:hypothetical protein